MAKKRVNVVTMGCSKNLVDSEVLLNQLEKGKFEVMHDSNDTNFDAVFVNTCGFIHDAKQESIDMILDYAEAKKRGEIDKLYVMGCLSERYHNELEDELPEVDKYFGKFDMKAMVEELKVTYAPEYIYERKITTPSHFAYLKISEGCNRSCSFCAIPKMTGRHQSRTIESLVMEARYLAKKGVKELLLIAQDLSYYGIDLYGKNQLAELINKVSEIEGIEWIRLHYLYPTKFPMEILPVMRENPKVCKYLDMPLQHIANNVLKNMLRHVTREETEALIAKIKEEVPGVVIRTTMLVGFPGETEEDFEELKAFVEEQKFGRLGVFPYSEEDGTYAASKFKDTLDQETKQERADEIMEVQQYISAELNQQKIGQEFDVIIDRKEGDYFVGRTEFDSPEVDGEVYITTDDEIKNGTIIKVKITGAEDYDLYGELI
ncbi:30S ribosomal protein S12 methylthiotransferase RimO [Draconibacterium sp. IB214405]|uniref:30S ribosomal protein S12 methylthiotransferase RimO n=1 Tax=Draconibacterium sp. IB214405 TaxID=3097352 RepID=UPI002A14ED7A|nr:30S ribosomal protein S12 methylthiotransferase RimO [Draconibacterium sp. IB214405]MDX8339479.1 30S ribosomal protein S12 methylthiotransferase RimO [Draconibacterium sp. IB214405]